MKISAKGFVQVRTGENFTADINIVSFWPISAIFSDVPLLECRLCSSLVLLHDLRLTARL